MIEDSVLKQWLRVPISATVDLLAILSRNLESTCNRVNCSRTANVLRAPTNRTTAD
jgi:hypothetical protein